QSLEDDPMTQILEKVLEEKYCENPSYVKVLIKALINTDGKESINGKWVIKTVYLSGSEIRKFYQNERVIRYILSQILKRPFKLGFKDRHNLQLIVLKSGDANE
ncbi:MAG: hypothetical protein QXS37_06750, partial [Candidatus Aenigmatarchaeota archaeon]